MHFCLVQNQRTIQTVLSLTSGELLEAKSLFANQQKREAEIFQLRTKIENQLQTNTVEYVCLYCKQPVAIRGINSYLGQSKHFFFTHPYNSNACIIKTKSKHTQEQVLCMKFNGQKESDRHITLKNLIGLYAGKTKNVTEVKIDEVYRDKEVPSEWRKPDVLAIYGSKKLAFELQLSTTFLSVIVARTRFYKENGVFLIWVFADFSMQNDMQKFTEKDVYYNNNFNVYVFDKEATDKSKATGELILKCIYKEFYAIGEELKEHWTTTFIKLSDLKFDSINGTVCYSDATVQKRTVQLEITVKRNERLETEKQLRINKTVENAVSYLREFYTHDFAPDYILENISTSEIVTALNDKLKFDSDKVEAINKLFFERRKPNFLSYLCDNSTIKIDTLKLERNGVRVLPEILSIPDREDFRRYITCLFRLKFYLNEVDTKILNDFYEKNSKNTTREEKENIERWAIVNVMSDFERLDNLKDVFKVEKLMFGIASLKYKMVIGAGFKHLLQVSHNFLLSHNKYSSLYLKAMKVYGQYDIQMNADKEGKLKLKIDKFYREQPQQDARYNHVIYEMFPELL